MLNRRFLRIKAFQALYGLSREEKGNAGSAKVRMLNGLDQSYGLYLFLLWFPVEFDHFMRAEMETESTKFLPSDQQIKRYQQVLLNRIPAILEGNTDLANLLKKYRVVWTDHHDLFRKIWLAISNHSLLESYVNRESNNLQDDKNFYLSLLEYLVVDSELFEMYMEERFVNWEDDQELVITTLQRTFQMIKEKSIRIAAAKHMDEQEDLKFVKDIFQLCLTHQQELTALIAEKTKNWDQDRIALVDLILMKMALCEVLYFPNIPVKVSINEYLELAKLYSTPNSHGFINGILDKVQIDLRNKSRIQKAGRGLVE